VVRARARLLADIRAFFAERDVIEVETPLLSAAPVTDPFIQAFSVSGSVYLQTSPEYAMKRLLAAGFPSMYQLTKAFRHEELGHLHNPEFTMLEWYRLDFGLSDLMNEMDVFLQRLLNVGVARRFTYQNLFLHCLDLDPFDCTVDDLKKRAKQENIQVVSGQLLDKDDWLQLLFTHRIEPVMGFDVPWFVSDYPASQAALSRLKPGNNGVAERFEVYYKGVELANGYHELDDAAIQSQRFLQDCEKRRQLNLPAVPIDRRLVEALACGLPNCAGVALGVDRLLMLQLGIEKIEEVLTFYWNRA
jgi:lysyl-tRNA synthetase class 2